MNKILITGANSYIGKKFIEYTNSFDDFSVEAISVRDDSWKAMDWSGYDVVYNVAGIAHIKETDENRHLYYEVNRDLAVELAKKAKAEGVRQFIYLSSMSVFGMVEGHITKDTPTHPVNAYGKSKLEAERQIMAMASSDFKVTIVRPPMVYGEGCKGNYQMLKKFALKFKAFPDVYNQRSMISIENMSKAVVEMVEQPRTSVLHPQDPEYVRTYDMVRGIAEDAGYRFHRIVLGRDLIRLMTGRVTVFKKVFGSLTYDYRIDERLKPEQGLVSIIMPMYNGAKYVAEAIASIQAQDYDNWELLVVNDGSTDEGPEIVKTLAAADTRIKLINKTNGGIASARNTGIKAAKGQYLAFLDSDDKWLEGKLTKQIELLKSKQAKFCYSATAFMTDDSTPLEKWWPVPAEVDYKKLLHANVIPCSSVLIDRTGLKSFLMPKQGHEDYATWLTILRDNKIKAYGLSEPLFRYRKSSSGASSKKLKTLSWTWHVYHDSQGFGWLKSTWCFFRFEWLTVWKYLRR
ncbi:Nucleoside-diphosphate-sugar epimerase [Pseudobutyrivibrio sp. ACV-2]|uniref:glycosyltransferase n=1 Tax=Pseudobutyrivibrio sp. ACV-2 TaxID=1520801 RepID=UPI00089A18F2|nr:glycosyltransferase [Pseudobutyrivibrio sp. ACV-2]SEB00717.1 Nucleoside-diphosphate-sugar epimerase [Pseudobutyrivibrio sp. ACV-2]